MFTNGFTAAQNWLDGSGKTSDTYGNISVLTLYRRSNWPTTCPQDTRCTDLWTKHVFAEESQINYTPSTPKTSPLKRCPWEIQD